MQKGCHRRLKICHGKLEAMGRVVEIEK